MLTPDQLSNIIAGLSLLGLALLIIIEAKRIIREAGE